LALELLCKIFRRWEEKRRKRGKYGWVVRKSQREARGKRQVLGLE